MFDHLRSVDAEPILLLTDERVRAFGVYTLPTSARTEQSAATSNRWLYLMVSCSAPEIGTVEVMHK